MEKMENLVMSKPFLPSVGSGEISVLWYFSFCPQIKPPLSKGSNLDAQVSFLKKG